MNRLFRPEAQKAHETQLLGQIVLASPVSFRYLATGAILTALLMLLFLIFGSYTQRTTVTGQLIPESGLMQVYGTQRGLVQQKFVEEGQLVEKDDPLFVLSAERNSPSQNNVMEAISKQVKSRIESLQEERGNTERYHRSERESLELTLTSLELEIASLEALARGQERRVDLAAANVTRYQDLSKQGHISQEQLQRSEADLLDQSNLLQIRQREQIVLKRELMAKTTTLFSLDAQHAKQIAQIDRNIAALQQELAEAEARREQIVTAPMSGVATAVTAEVGQVVDSHQVLLSIVPADARLQAILFVSSAAVGFVQPKDQVQIRYRAFPYQKYGHGKGQVISVSKAPMSSGNPNPSASDPRANNQLATEPLYKITAQLDRQTILAGGHHKSLQAGMVLEADIMRETRRLYEWVLEPLYSITGKL